ncbi:MAG TPA: hypothetical protein VMX38_03110 [Verrucomicrobiae bacterium]|nr:hypothetical protein [Verrucomicrobiae bacterium]
MSTWDNLPNFLNVSGIGNADAVCSAPTFFAVDWEMRGKFAKFLR